MGVEVQDAQPGVALGAGLYGSERDGVISAQDHRQGASVEGCAGALGHQVVDPGASGVDLCDPWIIKGDTPGLDDGQGSHRGSTVQRFDLLGDGSRVDPSLPGPTEAQVEEVDLVAGRDHCGGAEGSPPPEGRGGVEGHGVDPHSGGLGGGC